MVIIYRVSPGWLQQGPFWHAIVYSSSAVVRSKSCFVIDPGIVASYSSQRTVGNTGKHFCGVVCRTSHKMTTRSTNPYVHLCQVNDSTAAVVSWPSPVCLWQACSVLTSMVHINSISAKIWWQTIGQAVGQVGSMLRTNHRVLKTDRPVVPFSIPHNLGDKRFKLEFPWDGAKTLQLRANNAAMKESWVGLLRATLAEAESQIRNTGSVFAYGGR